MTGEVAIKLRVLGLSEPAAFGIFSGFGDFTQSGDSLSFFTGRGLGGYLKPPHGLGENRQAYAGATRQDDPVLSPMKSDLAGLPPTLFLTSTRDYFLSGTTLFHRAMLRAGDEAELSFLKRSVIPFGKIQHCTSQMRPIASLQAFSRSILKHGSLRRRSCAIGTRSRDQRQHNTPQRPRHPYFLIGAKSPSRSRIDAGTLCGYPNNIHSRSMGAPKSVYLKSAKSRCRAGNTVLR